MTPEQLQAIEARAGALVAWPFPQQRADVLGLIAEVRRLQAILAEFKAKSLAVCEWRNAGTDANENHLPAGWYPVEG